ncbi:MAG: hypothetical protein VB861_17805 [Planctomycetaceae bacterium]
MSQDFEGPDQGQRPPLSADPLQYRPTPQPEEGDATGGIIPYKNGPALAAYYLGIFSLLPCIGLVLAIPAFILGIIGLKKEEREPGRQGVSSCLDRHHHGRHLHPGVGGGDRADVLRYIRITGSNPLANASLVDVYPEPR